MRRLIRFIAPLLACIALQACSTNPATGRGQLLFLSEEEEIALGAEAAPQLTAEYGGEVESTELRDYVSRVGERLAARVEGEYRDLPWEFFLLDSDVINAFALPGGKVFLSQGLMSHMNNEAQLAAVLGHEIGHVTGRHANDRISRAMLLNGVATASGAIVGEEGLAQAVPLIVGVSGQGYLLHFSRSQESEADTLGMRYMAEAGYDPQGMLQLLQILVDASQGSRPPEFLSTHPDPDRRLSDARALLEEEYRNTQGNPSFDLYRQRFRRRAAPHLPEPRTDASAAAEAWRYLVGGGCPDCRDSGAVARP